MADKKNSPITTGTLTAGGISGQSSIVLPDPSEALINAFNKRTKILEDEVANFKKTNKEELLNLRKAFNKSSSNTEKLMIGVIIVLGVGFLALLFALIGTIATSWQTHTDSVKSDSQTSAISKLQQQQDSMVKVLNTIQTQTQPKQ